MLVPSDNKSVDLTDKQKDFLDALFGEANGDPKIAGEIAGYSHYTVPLKALKEEIIDRAEQVLAAFAPKASMQVINTMSMEESTTPGANVRLEAAKQVLDRIGLLKEKIDVNAKVAHESSSSPLRITRRRVSRLIPFGYEVAEENDKLLIEVPEEMELLTKAKKFIENHCSYRETGSGYHIIQVERLLEWD